MTCIWTRTGWLFLAVMLDLFSRPRRRLGDQLDERPNAVAESFLSTIETERMRKGIYGSHDEATASIGE